MNAIRSGGAARRALGALAPIALLGLLTACGAPKTHYPAVATQQAAQLAAESAAQSEVDPATTHRRLIEQMQREGLWFASLAHIDALEQRTGQTSAVQRLRADALRQTGQAAESRRVYERLAQAREPADAAAGLQGLGLLAGGDGDFARAAAWLEQARQHSPTDARLLGDLGYALLAGGRLDAARVPLMQAAQLQPEDPRKQLNMAAWLLASGQEARAQHVLAALAASEETRQAVRTLAARASEAARKLTRADDSPPISGVPNAGGSAGAGIAAGMPEPAPGTEADADPDGPGGAGPAAPIALRASGWKGARRVHVGVRRVGDAGVPATVPSDRPASTETTPDAAATAAP